MSLYDELITAYPELENENDIRFWSNTIVLQDDSDGQGAYIAKWDYEKPIPEGLKLGK
jgi:hypothetical protein